MGRRNRQEKQTRGVSKGLGGEEGEEKTREKGYHFLPSIGPRPSPGLTLTKLRLGYPSFPPTSPGQARWHTDPLVIIAVKPPSPWQRWLGQRRRKWLGQVGSEPPRDRGWR